MLHIYKSDCYTSSLCELDIAAPEKGAWFQLINPTAAELHKVAAAANVPMDFLKAALDEEERSRTELEDNCILIVTNVPVMRDKVNYDTLPLGIVLTKDFFITVCLENTEALSEFNATNSKMFSTFKKTRFLFQILYKSTTLYLRYLRQISRLTDEIERQLHRSMKNEGLFQLLELQKGLTYFSISLRSNGVVMEKLLRLRSNTSLQYIIKMFEEDEDLLEDVIIENKQAQEMAEMHTRILTGMVEIFASIISNNLNMVMKFLASITIIMAIPTMLASFFGMNVAIPLGENPNGFIYVSLISLGLALVSGFILWKKNMF